MQTFIIIANIIHLNNEISLLILDMFHDKKIFIRLAKIIQLRINKYFRKQMYSCYTDEEKNIIRVLQCHFDGSKTYHPVVYKIISI